MNWSYGVTTVPSRLYTTLPQTLESLARAGFDRPRLFVDGAEDTAPWKGFGLDLTMRSPKLNVAGNWVQSMWELYIRWPEADRFILFQDDMLTYCNLKQYLEKTQHWYPVESYQNLYTTPANQALRPKDKPDPVWFPSNQMGKGAVALMLTRAAVVKLFSTNYMAARFQGANGQKGIDGGIVTAFNNVGWKEYCHSPTLVQHIGYTKDHADPKKPDPASAAANLQAPVPATFLGETFDALDLLRPK